MKKIFVRFLKYLTKNLEEEHDVICQPELQQEIKQEHKPEIEGKSLVDKVNKPSKKQSEKKEKTNGKKIKSRNIVTQGQQDIIRRDIMELMEVPFVSLSKNRTEPIIYESPDGKSKVKISRHTEHYIASIYDWDIILFVASKLQEIINDKSDIPPRTLIVPRNELIKAIFRHTGKTTDNEVEAALNRLRSTLIETTIHNSDYRYKGGFGFLDSWGYTERKDIKEFRITLSEWLYALTCRNGSLLKVHPDYFKITSGLKRFLYRTARKHVGTQNNSWQFLTETLHKKSGSEQPLKTFKFHLKKAVKDNDIPEYHLKWMEENGKTLVCFINLKQSAKKSLTSSESTACKSYKPSNPSNSKQKRIISDLISSSIKRIK